MTGLFAISRGRRDEVAASGGLSALAASLAGDLATARSLGLEWLPPEKAKLTRRGGRCRTDSTLLVFDPGSPREHRCLQCGTVYRDEADYRWWIMNYQLWLAERAVHGAALAFVTAAPDAAAMANSILAMYVERYLAYPNVDNVLGPSRLFFSTYLESIWLLQVSTALDLLEASSAASPSLGGRVRERVIEPAAALIAAYNEGDSNRQVWNNAALAAAGVLVGNERQVEEATLGRTGLVHHLSTGLLADGTWYEGENYHLFAHRGLWYGVAVAERAGLRLPPDLVDRFQAGFRTPFVTALPDFTFPARRDSQYGVSLRQWRIAESCELGLVRQADDVQLMAALHELYRSDVPQGETGRAHSTAEAERNVPPVRLTRASLGWKSLLLAQPELPPLAGTAPVSALLANQGYGVIRRNGGSVYAALDYGHSGNGHGHPDRLNLWLVNGADRVLEDPGTGSYTSPTLHWYRSSLAHNAPFVDGVSQDKVDGKLLGFGDSNGIGWIAAAAEIADGVVVKRTIVLLEDCLVDELSWLANRNVQLDLPVHVSGVVEGVSEWEAALLDGGAKPEDGFSFLHDTQRAAKAGPRCSVTHGETRAWYDVSTSEWWRATAPGPPGSPPRTFYLQRSRGRNGRLRSVWTWSRGVTAAAFTDDEIIIRRQDGSVTIGYREDGVQVAFSSNASSPEVLIRLDPVQPSPRRDRPVTPNASLTNARILRAHSSLGSGGADLPHPLVFELGEHAYRRSELDWAGAGRPTARVELTADATNVTIDVTVRTSHAVFAAARDENPLDNEHPDTNSDGVQLYLGTPGGRSSWILVPNGDGSAGVRVTPREASGTRVVPTAHALTQSHGWTMRISIPRDTLPARGLTPFTFDLIVNLMAPHRERREGQLVLSGGRGEWTYLRGDRQDAHHAIPFVIIDD